MPHTEVRAHEGKEEGSTVGDQIGPRKRSVENGKSLAPSKYLQMRTLCLTKVIIIFSVIAHSLKLNGSFELGSKGQINWAS